MFSGADAPWHWFILAILVVVLFGYRKLPDAARSLGRSLRIFKTEIKGMTEDDEARAAGRAEIIAPGQPAPAPTEVPARPGSTAPPSAVPPPSAPGSAGASPAAPIPAAPIPAAPNQEAGASGAT